MATGIEMPRCQQRFRVRQPSISSTVAVVGLVLLMNVASFLPAGAQSAPPTTTCSDEARRGLAAIGAWADAQCSAVPPLDLLNWRRTDARIRLCRGRSASEIGQ